MADQNHGGQNISTQVKVLKLVPVQHVITYIE